MAGHALAARMALCVTEMFHDDRPSTVPVPPGTRRSQSGPAGARGRRVGWPGLLIPYRVIAMETGALPTLIALPALPVTMEIGVTVPEPLLTT